MTQNELEEKALEKSLEAVSEPLSTIGGALNGLFQAALFPLLKLNVYKKEQLEQYAKDIKENLNSIPEGKKIDPKIEVLGPILESSKYSLNSDELRILFSNLIASSVNSELESYVHSSFSEIIKQLSPLDARILSSFKDSKSNRVMNKSVCKYRVEKKSSAEGADVFTNVFLHADDKDFIPSRATSLENLKRLGLVFIDYTSSFVKDDHYTLLENTQALIKLERDVSLGKYTGFDSTTVKRGIVTPTPLGEDFIRVCL